jgi:uncharacterized membrane protein
MNLSSINRVLAVALAWFFSLTPLLFLVFNVKNDSLVTHSVALVLMATFSLMGVVTSLVIVIEARKNLIAGLVTLLISVVLLLMSSAQLISAQD